MVRRLLAFLLAPLWVPAVIGVYASQVMFPYEGQGHWVVIAVTLSAALTYGATLVLGVPAYLGLHRRQWTSLWAAAGAGFLIGAFAWQVFAFMFAAMGSGSDVAARTLLAQQFVPYLLETLKPALLGGLVGMTAWLILRPARANDGKPAPSTSA